MSRESLAHALSGPVSLAEDQWRERDVDRLHALAAAQIISIARGKSLLVPLGRELIAYLDGGCQQSGVRAKKGLADALLWREHRLRLTNESATLVATLSISEAKSGACRVCNGRIDANGVFSVPDVDKIAGWREGDGPVPMRPCPSCYGSGRHRFSDSERAEAFGDLHKNTIAAFEVAHSLIGGACIEAMTGFRKLYR